jgi:hypothetical protein
VARRATHTRALIWTTHLVSARTGVAKPWWEGGSIPGSSAALSHCSKVSTRLHSPCTKKKVGAQMKSSLKVMEWLAVGIWTQAIGARAAREGKGL